MQLELPHKPFVAIPDLHGHLDRLDRLLERLDQRKLLNGRRLLFLGDYVDRGCKVAETVERVLALQTQHDAIALCGNHEAILANVIGEKTTQWEAFVRIWSRFEDRTLESYGVRRPTIHGWEQWYDAAENLRTAMPFSHNAFLSRLPWYYEDERHIAVHAGLHPRFCWAVQRKLLDRRKLTVKGVPQLFSHDCSRIDFHIAVPKCLITGHLITPTPEISPWRIKLNGGVEKGGPLFAWVSDTKELVQV